MTLSVAIVAMDEEANIGRTLASVCWADEIVLAPVFRSTLPEAQRLSIPDLVQDLKRQGKSARAAASIDDIVSTIVTERRDGDLVVMMSNGGFGGIHKKLLHALSGVEGQALNT